MSLLALQQDFRHWLTREPSELPAAFDPHHRGGLAVYLNNYRSQLLACLSASFPAVRSSLGEAAFEAAAARHIDEVPPHSWTLDEYATGFPESLKKSYTHAPHIVELAQLELALATAFVGADAQPIDAAQLADVDWDAALIHFTPGLVFLPVTTNVGAIWSAIGADEAPPAAEQLPELEWLALWRSTFTSRFRVVSCEEREVISALRAGVSFGRICAGLVEKQGEERGTAAAGAMLARWLGDGLIVGISA